ncbi:BTB/POZ domain-containing protein [Plectosphaerella plurivora]|uniref:BTB/POZ domain-containing protein n=1 Tax=Plectosphaerella plurivora TaxID=936078 RepID=A0A9P8VBJ7_9PEZI|nr:BTB/POZ domain-containing protein [Plectosphaerella plurivora]
MVLNKGALEAQLRDEHELIQSGVLRDENPLDVSEGFNQLIQASRRGDLKTCQELISAGVNINGKDKFDYTPLIIASLCGHYELVELLLESGALAERHTFQGERCIYNALNDRIRNLLLAYDYSKSTDPLQPWSTHITSLLSRDFPKTSDINLLAASDSFHLHKFILASRSPYFRRKFSEASHTTSWNLPATIPADAFRLVLRYLYLGDIPKDLVDPRSMATEEEVLISADKISKQLEVEKLWEAILTTDRRLARQKYQDEVERAQEQITDFFHEKVLGHKMTVDATRIHEVKWQKGNAIFADCLLSAVEADDETETNSDTAPVLSTAIPIGPAAAAAEPRKTRRAVLYPVHKAMLLRSPYFETMFASEFKEAQEAENLHVITVDCTPEVLQVVLTFLYTEKLDFKLDIALDVLYTADMLFLEKLKTKAAQAISTLGSGNSNALIDRTHGAADENGEGEMEPLNIYDVIHAAWDLRVQRLEEFAARYLAHRLEDYIDEEDFADLIKESADRLKTREETDTIELLDDIRYYLSERFRLRFEDAGLDEIMDEEGELNAATVAALADAAGEGSEAEVKDEVLKVPEPQLQPEVLEEDGGVTTLDGSAVRDEFESDAINYQILLGKIDTILERLKLDA